LKVAEKINLESSHHKTKKDVKPVAIKMDSVRLLISAHDLRVGRWSPMSGWVWSLLKILLLPIPLSLPSPLSKNE